MQQRVSFEASQPQRFKNKYYLIAQILKVAAAWLSSASPALSANKTRLMERPQQKHVEHGAHSFHPRAQSQAALFAAIHPAQVG